MRKLLERFIAFLKKETSVDEFYLNNPGGKRIAERLLQEKWQEAIVKLVEQVVKAISETLVEEGVLSKDLHLQVKYLSDKATGIVLLYKGAAIFEKTIPEVNLKLFGHEEKPIRLPDESGYRHRDPRSIRRHWPQEDDDLYGDRYERMFFEGGDGL